MYVILRYYCMMDVINEFIDIPVPPDTERVNYRRPGFFAKFMELNKVMWDVNKGLTSSHPYDSRPSVSSHCHLAIMQ